MSNLSNFHYAQTLLDLLYNINIEDDVFEEIALIGWNLIGNKRCRLYKYTTDGCTGSIDLPCNADIIEAVTTDDEEWNEITNHTSYGEPNSAYTEAWIEYNKSRKSPLYVSGKFIKYERVGNTLILGLPYSRVNILYKGVMLDDDGLPELTDKEATALATYCAYILKFKEGLTTNNLGIVLLAEVLKLKWATQVELARNDHYMSLNDWDLVMDAKTNWARKQYSKSFKLYK